jgi:hypothetical protein
MKPPPSRSVFISAENTAGERVAQVVHPLETAGYAVTTSPLRPALGDDLRWEGWYDNGCKKAIESNDVVVAIVTASYDSSTWMLEFRKRGSVFTPSQTAAANATGLGDHGTYFRCAATHQRESRQRTPCTVRAGGDVVRIVFRTIVVGVRRRQYLWEHTRSPIPRRIAGLFLIVGGIEPLGRVPRGFQPQGP